VSEGARRKAEVSEPFSANFISFSPHFSFHSFLFSLCYIFRVIPTLLGQLQIKPVLLHGDLWVLYYR
jgi:hypothetical protein